ncbi:hypothetical protein RRG08_065525, partial [Elysia crispata]
MFPTTINPWVLIIDFGLPDNRPRIADDGCWIPDKRS